MQNYAIVLYFTSHLPVVNAGRKSHGPAPGPISVVNLFRLLFRCLRCGTDDVVERPLALAHGDFGRVAHVEKCDYLIRRRGDRE